MLARILLVLAFALVLITAPAAAFAAADAASSTSAQVPEGSHATLFALGLIGVIVGRRLSMRARSKAKNEVEPAE